MPVVYDLLTVYDAFENVAKSTSNMLVLDRNTIAALIEILYERILQ